MTKWFWISYTLFPYPVETKVSGRIRLNFEKCFRVWYIFLKAIFCPEKENENLKIFGWEKSPLEYHIFWQKHPRKKWKKVDPHYFRGGLLSSLLSKKSSITLKTSILPSKIFKMAISRYFSGNYSLRHLKFKRPFKSTVALNILHLLSFTSKYRKQTMTINPQRAVYMCGILFWITNFFQWLMMRTRDR